MRRREQPGAHRKALPINESRRPANRLQPASRLGLGPNLAAVALGDLLRRADRLDEADEVLKPFENVVAAKTILARIRLQRGGVSLDGDLDLTLEHLLEQSSSATSAKDSLLEILDALGPGDPRYVSYRRKLASRLY